MDRDSDNFTAELMLKQLGAEVGGAGTTAAGAAVVLRDLAAAGVPLAGVRIVDGSGLSLDDRLTARALASMLVAAWSNADLRQSSCARFRSPATTARSRSGWSARPARGVVRAKTGTTNRASALSGYVGDRYVVRDHPERLPRLAWAAREAQDRFATALASTCRSACSSASSSSGTPAFSAFATFEPGLSPTTTPVVFFETLSETFAPSASSAARASLARHRLERAGDHVLGAR